MVTRPFRLKKKMFAKFWLCRTGHPHARNRPILFSAQHLRCTLGRQVIHVYMYVCYVIYYFRLQLLKRCLCQRGMYHSDGLTVYASYKEYKMNVIITMIMYIFDACI